MNPRPPATPARTSAWAMYRAIVGIATLCALLIVTVYQATAARIADNRARALRAAIAEVLPRADATLQLAPDARGRLAPAVGDAELPAFLGYDRDGRLIGAAITAEGMGYQDNIRVLYAYAFDTRAIVGLKVLESKETPGLGDRVETESHFLASFEALDASLDSAGNALANPIVTVKQGEKRHAWEIDGITGATITSQAIGRILDESAGVWVPALERDAARLAPPDATEASR